VDKEIENATQTDSAVYQKFEKAIFEVLKGKVEPY
jgi:hypothetical protein